MEPLGPSTAEVEVESTSVDVSFAAKWMIPKVCSAPAPVSELDVSWGGRWKPTMSEMLRVRWFGRDCEDFAGGR